jgi:hypothetical protein
MDNAITGRLVMRWKAAARYAFLVMAVTCLLVVLAPESTPDTTSLHSASVLVEGEELVYNVRYGFIDLGQVKIMTHERIQKAGYTAYNGEAVIRSYKGVPFVDLHAEYQSVVDTVGFSRQFVGKSRENGDWEVSRYFFEYERDRVVMETGGEHHTERRDTLALESYYHDGLSLFFYARDQLFSGRRMTIPTLVREKKGMTEINFKMERSSVQNDFIDYPVDVIGFDGTAGFVGVFGLTGDFEGWFSNDDARVPIMANMKVIIGSVTIELVSWKRPGWTPPQGEED